MAQALAIIIIAIILKLLWDYIRGQEPRQQKSKKKGTVIDISDAWIHTASLPYNTRNFLMTNRELAAYNMVESILANSSYAIAPKIRMAEVLTVSPQADHYQEYYNRLNDRILDMLILEKPELKPVLVIHFEDQNDPRKKQLADQFKERALKSAGLPSFTLSLNHDLDLHQVERQLQNAGLHIREFGTVNK